jgi:hypothetical protein
MINDLKVINNFYTNPAAISALVDNFGFDITGCGFGKRSPQLWEIDQSLGEDVKNALCQIHSVDPNKVNISTFFMYSDTVFEDDFLNRSAPHIDGKNQDTCRLFVKPEDYNLIFCGHIFMTPNPDPDASVFTHEFKNPEQWDWEEMVKQCIDEYSIPSEKYREGKINLDQYKAERILYEQHFNVACEVKNVYNKMVSWKAGTLHSMKITKNVPKMINQYFFAEWK